ncbi:MAG: hypothetical protein LBV17_08000 [Treponema sp.]|jgi:hypothetical protein|nr:hypothetical protein [Treponema sp.]
MNTTPSIFNQNITPYTSIGGRNSSDSEMCAVILNRPGIPHRAFFQELEKTGFDSVISVEPSSPNYNIEELSQRFPFVRFIIPEKEITTGEQINLAASEIDNRLFFVIGSDMKIIAGGTARRMAERLIATQEDAGVNSSAFKRLCTVPVIVNSNYEPIPTIVTPLTRHKKLWTGMMEPHNEGELSLYPFNGIGIYDHQRFTGIGGFDTAIKNTHWQLMDFGFRAYLWGEEISLSLHLKLLCEKEFPSADFSADKGYRQFYLKNLAPVFRNNYAHLPFSRFIPFLFKSNEDIFSAWEEFSKKRKWVTENKNRFKSDDVTVINRWNNIPAQTVTETEEKQEST